jgi:hypothetical protein
MSSSRIQLQTFCSSHQQPQSPTMFRTMPTRCTTSLGGTLTGKVGSGTGAGAGVTAAAATGVAAKSNATYAAMTAWRFGLGAPHRMHNARLPL